jgi:uncharacterized protein YcnI
MRLTFVMAAAVVVAAPALAHVTVWPRTSVAGAGEKYSIRVPNERQSDMIAVEVRFPAGLALRSFEQKPGWRTEPLRDASGAIVGARWIGKLPPEQFVEFGILAKNPAPAGDLLFPALQAYEDGTKIEWSGRAGSKTPAPRVTLTP